MACPSGKTSYFFPELWVGTIDMRFEINLDCLSPGEHLSGNASQDWCGPGINANLGKGEAKLAGNGNSLLILIGQARLAGNGTLSANQLLDNYTQSGPLFLDGLLGRFAIAVVDATQHRVLLANDRMSIHGWCYHTDGKSISFSDRADTIGHPEYVSRQALLGYLLQHIIPSPETIYNNVSRLPPAHRLMFSLAGSDLAPHWTPVQR